MSVIANPNVYITEVTWLDFFDISSSAVAADQAFVGVNDSKETATAYHTSKN